MTPKFVVRFALIALVLSVFSATLAAQAVEIYPNAGFYWPSTTNFGKIKADGIYGIKAGTFLDQNVELEGSVSYLNHFVNGSQPAPFALGFGVPNPGVWSLLYDVNGAWNFGSRSVFGHRVSPFISAGVGGLTAYVKHANSAQIVGGGFIGFNSVTGEPIPNPGRSVVLNDADTFFTINYGGGVKAMNLWGPMGLRADLKGRTIPNWFGQTMSWPEITGGVVFTWGER
jgi:Outer membrane protein beta-barrel domain